MALVEGLFPRTTPLRKRAAALLVQTWELRQEFGSPVRAAQDAFDAALALGERLNKQHEVVRRIARPKMSAELLLVQVQHALDNEPPIRGRE